MSRINQNLNIGVTAVAASSDPQKFEAGLRYLHKLGVSSVIGVDPCAELSLSCTAASPQERASGLHQLFENKSIDAIICSRGGYGSAELLPLLDKDLISVNAKPLVGYSDVSALLLYLADVTAVVHGPCISVEFAAADSGDSIAIADAKELLSLLSGNPHESSFQLEQLSGGNAEGRVVATNLTILTTLLGTPYMPDLSGAILLLEDIAEPPYRVKRSLLQLIQSGVLDSVAALLFGRFAQVEEVDFVEFQRVFTEELFGDAAFPVFSGLEFGHCGANPPFLLNSKGSIKSGELIISQGL